jgi:hypothetical protein
VGLGFAVLELEIAQLRGADSVGNSDALFAVVDVFLFEGVDLAGLAIES